MGEAGAPRKPKQSHGQGTYTERVGKDGKVHIQARVLVDGKRWTRTFPTKREAQRWVRKTVGDAEQNMLTPEGESTTVGAYLDRWLAAATPSLRPSTVKGYAGIIKNHLAPGLGRHRLTRLRADQVQAFYAAKIAGGLSPRMVQLCHAVLHRALNQAVKWYLVPRNVADAVDVPRIANRHKVLAWSVADSQRFLAGLRAGEERLEALYVVALTTGLRQGELLGLHWDDVDLDHARMTISRQLQRQKGAGLVECEPKSAAGRRTVALTGRAVDALKRWRHRQKEERAFNADVWRITPYVFTSTVGGPLEPTNVSHRFHATIVKLGLPVIRFHDLRHSCASLLLAAGQHPKLVQELLGHSQISLTMDTYSHVMPSLHTRVADAMDAILGDEPTAAGDNSS